MEQVHVICSYWYGLHDEGQYGEDCKVERVVKGTLNRAREVERDIAADLKDSSRFCYTDIITTEICE